MNIPFELVAGPRKPPPSARGAEGAGPERPSSRLPYHAEALDGEGRFNNENLRSAAADIEYLLAGSGAEHYTPTLTFFGFRYARVRIEGRRQSIAASYRPCSHPRTDGADDVWHWGVRFYRSRDLYNWEDLGSIIPPDLDDPTLGTPGCRPGAWNLYRVRASKQEPWKL